MLVDPVTTHLPNSGRSVSSSGVWTGHHLLGPQIQIDTQVDLNAKPGTAFYTMSPIPSQSIADVPTFEDGQLSLKILGQLAASAVPPVTCP